MAFAVCREIKVAGGEIKNKAHPNLSNGERHVFHGKESCRLFFACDLSLLNSPFNSDFNCSFLSDLIFYVPSIYVGIMV